ncbi:TetR/AcrR family transcriptional regulator [Curtobacterium sp. ZW137]|uniref:TetR/AcrR family transcriptional regulator n=1 Tax=Curtobacterium sp. ZW137 TaxID=2485104 RepID=UPI000F4C4416|nr:TetR/AcrR family transcriptional regulator [Curtobacterium sp. ZW137]ROP60889.1 TetR family transcriptional regulator [Curtobacterium sp. ZW137]
MPTPDRTTLDAIVAAARDLLEEDGLAGVTMQGVAVRVGVRAPSLYKRVENRDRLLQLVAEETLLELTARLDAAADARALLDTYRGFGKERPAAFRLVMTPGAGTPVADTAVQAASSAAILRVAAALAGEAEALEAARLLTAWATGFISMELNGAFRLGGDIDRAWDYGIAHLVDAITR